MSSKQIKKVIKNKGDEVLRRFRDSHKDQFGPDQRDWVNESWDDYVTKYLSEADDISSGKRPYEKIKIAYRLLNEVEQAVSYKHAANPASDRKRLEYLDAIRRRAIRLEKRASERGDEETASACSGLVKRIGKNKEELNPRGSRYYSFMALSIAGVLGGIFFLSTNITGNAVANLSSGTTSWIGMGLLAIGLVAGFFWIRSKKK